MSDPKFAVRACTTFGGGIVISDDWGQSAFIGYDELLPLIRALCEVAEERGAARMNDGGRWIEGPGWWVPEEEMEDE